MENAISQEGLVHRRRHFSHRTTVAIFKKFILKKDVEVQKIFRGKARFPRPKGRLSHAQVFGTAGGAYLASGANKGRHARWNEIQHTAVQQMSKSGCDAFVEIEDQGPPLTSFLYSRWHLEAPPFRIESSTENCFDSLPSFSGIVNITPAKQLCSSKCLQFQVILTGVREGQGVAPPRGLPISLLQNLPNRSFR